MSFRQACVIPAIYCGEVTSIREQTAAPSGNQIVHWSGTENDWRLMPYEAHGATYFYTGSNPTTLGSPPIVMLCYFNSFSMAAACPFVGSSLTAVWQLLIARSFSPCAR